MVEKQSILSKVQNWIGEMGLARGTLGNAIITCVTRLLFFVIVPVLFLNIFISLAYNDPDPSAPLFIEGAEQLRTYIALIGILLSICAGLWAFHLRQTKARLYLGLTASMLLVAYGAVLLLTPAFEQILTALGWYFPPWVVFGLICYRALRNILRFVSDYYIFSDRAKRKAAGEAIPKPFKPELGRGEFTFKNGNKANAASQADKHIKSTITRFPFWIVFVMWFLSIFTFGDTPNQALFLDVLTAMASLFLIVGIPMTILAILTGFYPKGSIPRTVFDVSNSLLFIFLVYWIFVSSGLAKYIADNGIILSVAPIILAILLWAFVDLIRTWAEFKDERRIWKKSVGYEVPPKKPKYFKTPPESKWYDFNPSIGKFSRGAVDAKKDVLRFVTLPELLILLTIGALRSTGATGTIFDIVQTWSITVLVFGLLISFVSFWRGYFPPGTWSRLILGLVYVLALALYIIGIGLGGGLDDALKDIGIIVPMQDIVVLVYISLVLVTIIQFADLGDYRRSWKIAVGKSVKPLKPIKKMTRLQEFRVRFASKHEGAIWLRKGIIRYVFYTSIAIIVLITVVNSLIYAGIGVDLSTLSRGLGSLFIELLVIAIPLALFRAIYGFYPGGSTSKLVAGLLMAATGALYTYVGLRGGNIMASGEWGTVKAGIEINFGFIVTAFLIGWLIWATFVLVEYLSYRKAWIAHDYQPVETKEGEEMLRFEKMIVREEKRVTKLDEKAKKRAARRAARKGTSIAEEEKREVAAKEAGVKISEVDEEEEEEEEEGEEVEEEEEESQS